MKTSDSAHTARTYRLEIAESRLRDAIAFCDRRIPLRVGHAVTRTLQRAARLKAARTLLAIK